MKTNIMKIGPVLLAVGICGWGMDLRAQETTTTAAATVTTTNGAFTEFVPGSETIVVRTEANAAPLRYVVTKQTTIVDEGGAPVVIEKISPGSPLSVEYTGTGDRLVASRIVVRKTPVVTERNATTTTTTTTRPLTRDEKEAVKEEVEKRKEQVEKAKEKEKERVEELKDKAEDEDD
jgi:hypothetical protein